MNGSATLCRLLLETELSRPKRELCPSSCAGILNALVGAGALSEVQHGNLRLEITPPDFLLLACSEQLYECQAKYAFLS